MKSACSLIICLFVLITQFGCTRDKKSQTERLILTEPGAPEGQEKTPAPYTVALVMKTLTNPFFKSMENGARKAETELGIKLIVKTGAKETSIEQQIAIIRELIRDKVDAIIIAPASSTELIPALVQAKNAGIRLVNIDNRLDVTMARRAGIGDVPFISVNNEQGAYLSAKALADRITTPTKAVILEGIRSAQNAQDRLRGAQRAFAENALITLVATETAHWKLDEGFSVTASLFLHHPDIGAIFCANDMMALGAVKYLEESGKDQVLVAAYDALDEAKRAIRRGKLLATIDQKAETQGYMGVVYAVRALAGETLPPETFIDVELVTSETLKHP